MRFSGFISVDQSMSVLVGKTWTASSGGRHWIVIVATALKAESEQIQPSLLSLSLCLTHKHTLKKEKKRKFTHAIAILVLFFITACVSAGRGGRLLASSLPHVDVRVHGSGRGRMLPTLRHRPLPG